MQDTTTQEIRKKIPQHTVLEAFLRDVQGVDDVLNDDAKIVTRAVETSPGSEAFEVEMTEWDCYKVYQTILDELDGRDYIDFKGWRIGLYSVRLFQHPYESDYVEMRCEARNRHGDMVDYFAVFDVTREVVQLSGDDGNRVVVKLDEDDDLPADAEREAWMRGMVEDGREVVDGVQFVDFAFL